MTLVTVDLVGPADYTVGGRCKSVPRVVDQYAGWYSHAPRFDVWRGTGLVPGTPPDIRGQTAVPLPRQLVGVRTGRLDPSRWIPDTLEGCGVSAPATDDLVIGVCGRNGQDQVPATDRIVIIPSFQRQSV